MKTFDWKCTSSTLHPCFCTNSIYININMHIYVNAPSLTTDRVLSVYPSAKSVCLKRPPRRPPVART